MISLPLKQIMIFKMKANNEEPAPCPGERVLEQHLSNTYLT